MIAYVHTVITEVHQRVYAVEVETLDDETREQLRLAVDRDGIPDSWGCPTTKGYLTEELYDYISNKPDTPFNEELV